jgi:hypothetical protein
MAKEPNYGLRRGVAITAASSLTAGAASVAGALSRNPARSLAEAGLDNAPQDIANHLMGTAGIGLVGGAVLGGAYVATRAIQNRKNRNLNPSQFK